MIGIGTGNPEHMTIEAIAALNAADVVFALDKGPQKSDLTRLRKEICARFSEGEGPRWVEAESPKRDAAGGYKQGVADWHAAKGEAFAKLIRHELKDGETGAFLVWGDPSLYDSTLRILPALAADKSLAIEYEVIPGISSLHALAAAHKMTLNTVGEAVLITTGRKLAQQGFPDCAETVVVMLDGGTGLNSLAGQDLEIWWGAYLGSEDEVLRQGKVAEVLDDILATREKHRAEKGWIMDIYLLRRLA